MYINIIKNPPFYNSLINFRFDYDLDTDGIIYNFIFLYIDRRVTAVIDNQILDILFNKFMDEEYPTLEQIEKVYDQL